MRLTSLIIAVSVLISMFIAGCQSVPVKKDKIAISYTGESCADTVLKKDTLLPVYRIVMKKGCDSIENIDTRVIKSEPLTGNYGHVSGVEEWIVTGCKSEFPLIVTFIEDGSGGTYIMVVEKNSVNKRN
ncbi:MAG: hypothetical protein KAJ62_06775 [Desulfobacteraceae bacterium]|nr:hypothetical protein [Desulfobacteraceae bacterium]